MEPNQIKALDIQELLQRNQGNRPPRAHVSHKRGMNELADVITNQGVDIVRNNNLMNIKDATEWANKKGFTAHEADYNNDGITDVYVKDKNGNLVSMNGYTTKNSNWINEYVYNNVLPASVRKQMRKDGEEVPSKKNVRDVIYGINYKLDNPYMIDETKTGYYNPALLRHDNARSALAYIKNVENLPVIVDEKKYKVKGEKSLKRERSAYDVFNTEIFSVIWAGFKDAYIKMGFEPAEFNREYPVSNRSKALSELYKRIIIYPLIGNTYGDNAQQIIDDKQLYDRVVAAKDMKEAIKQSVLRLYNIFRTNAQADDYIRNELKNTTVFREQTDEIMNEIFNYIISAREGGVFLN